MVGNSSTQAQEKPFVTDDNQLLIREARRRQRRFRAGIGALVVLIAISILVIGYHLGGSSAGPRSNALTPAQNAKTLTHSSPTRFLQCNGVAAIRPKNFIIACADGNTAVQNTHWTTWSESHAVGTTTFVVNLCVPYCAASPLTTIHGAKVELSRPVKHRNATYFTSVDVLYTFKGKVHNYEVSNLPTHPLN
ncbi:MAG: hypothetical protein ACP5O0_08040 [Acidimicrobiales bacterium]